MKRVLRVVACYVFAATVALSVPITFTITGTATGTLGSTSFNNASFTVMSLADTSLVSLVGSIYTVTATSSSISIAGQPVATFTDPTYWSDPQGAGDIIFGDLIRNPGLFPGILGITVLFQGLESYNLQSSFGPIFSPLDFPSSIFHTFANIPTSQGALSLVASNETFTASVPEPTCIVPLFLAFTTFAAVRRSTSSKARG